MDVRLAQDECISKDDFEYKPKCILVPLVAGPASAVVQVELIGAIKSSHELVVHGDGFRFLSADHFASPCSPDPDFWSIQWVAIRR